MLEDRYSLLLFQIASTGCFLGAAATGYFLLGLAGYVQNLPINLAVAVAVGVSWLFFLRHFVSALRETNWAGRAIWLAVTAILALEIVLSLVPPISRDALTHHLALPRLYARAGRILEVPFAPYSYYPMLLDMLYTPWVVWSVDFVPKLIHGLFGILTGLALYAYLSRRLNVVYGLLGFLIFVSIPVVLRLMHLAYVDLGITFYSTVSLLCIVRWRERRDRAHWLILAALCAGFTVAAKPNGFVTWPLLCLFFAFAAARPPERGFGKSVSELIVFAVFGALPFLPWLIKNWLQTGNPLYPFMTGFFPSHITGGAAEAASFVGLGIFGKRELLYGESWWQIAALPLRLFFTGRDNQPQYFDGALSPILLLFLPWAFKGKWLDEKCYFIAFAAVYLAYAIFLVDLRVRYVLPIVPPLVILLVYGIFNTYLRIKRPAYLFLLLAGFGVFHLTYLWGYFTAISPVPYLMGRESRDQFLDRRLPEYATFAYINGKLPASAKIYLLFIGRRAYYCERDYFHDGGELPGFLLGVVQAAKEPAQIEASFNRKSVTHLMVREDLLNPFLDHNLSTDQKLLWREFASQHLQLLFRDHGYSLYALHG